MAGCEKDKVALQSSKGRKRRCNRPIRAYMTVTGHNADNRRRDLALGLENLRYLPIRIMVKHNGKLGDSHGWVKQYEKKEAGMEHAKHR